VSVGAATGSAMKTRATVLVVLFFLTGLACRKDSSAPTTPAPLPNAAALIPEAPAPQPTPTPTPGPPEDDPLPATPGGGAGGDVGTCGQPLPPPVSRINVKVYGRQPDRVMLDSTPLVGPDGAYCRAIGYQDGRSYCPVRVDGDPERLACEGAVIGRASDTGRIGPTWTADGRPCTGPGPGASCANHPANQFFMYAYGAGTFRACAESGVCGELSLP
jgi:hypothetical protein